MIKFVTKEGREFEVDEESFPIRVVPECETLVNERKLYLNWTYIAVNGEKTRFVKSMNLGR